MPAPFRRLIHAVCLGSLLGIVGSTYGAVIESQEPCAGASGYCLQFTPGAAIPVIRTFEFNAPSPGNAVVTFHGSLVCSNETVTDKVVDLVTQIVSNAGDTPVVTGAGALRLAKVLKDTPDHAFNTTDTVNLASTRVFPVSMAGIQTFLFKIEPLRMDVGTVCSVYNAAFTVQFTPPALPVRATPAIASFGDVPPTHPFFAFIEALVASGITAGCGSGNYCPDAALTRGQMAVFLSKGLGLYFAP